MLTFGALLSSFFDDVSDECPDCPANAFLLVDSPTALAVVNGVLLAVGLPALIASLYVFRRRWRAASAPLRRVLLPVYLTAGTTIVLLAVALVVATVSDVAANALFWIVIFSFASVPFDVGQ